MPKQPEPVCLRFDLRNKTLWKGEEKIPLDPQWFAVLQYLAERRGNFVSSTELLHNCWDAVVSPQVVKSVINKIRKALGDTAKNPRYIETAPKRGYRLIGEILIVSPRSNVPYRRNPNFTGREKLLSKLRPQRTQGKPALCIQILTGLGGVGKTQIAIEYAYAHMEDYSRVWWMNSASSETLTTGYVELATELDLSEKHAADSDTVAKAVQRWLGQYSDWLLIFDNASLSLLHHYLPKGGKGHILITSRDPNWKSIGRSFPVDVLERKESVDFLHRWKPEIDKSDEKAMTDLAKLAQAFGDFPLAMAQAGAYLEQTSCSVSEYLELFHQNRQELLKKPLSSVDYPASLVAAWELSLREISQAGKDLLNLCAFLAPDDIPKELFTDEKLTDEKQNRLLPGSLKERLAVNDAIASLRRHSFLECGPDTLSIHCLLQDVVRDVLPEDKHRRLARKALRLANKALGEWSRGRVWTRSLRLLPHAEKALGYAEAALPRVAIADKYHVKLFRAIQEDTRGQPQRAEEVCRELLRQMDSNKDERYATVCINLATFCDHDGRPKEGLDLLKPLVQQLKAKRRSDTRYWWAQYQMGIMHRRLGEDAKAKKILWDVHKHAPVPSNNYTGAWHQLGLISLDCKQYDEAEKIFMDCLVERQNHKDYRRAYEFHRLGLLYAQTKRRKEAEEALRESIKITKTYGFQRYLNEIKKDLIEFGFQDVLMNDVIGE